MARPKYMYDVKLSHITYTFHPPPPSAAACTHCDPLSLLWWSPHGHFTGRPLSQTHTHTHTHTHTNTFKHTFTHIQYMYTHACMYVHTDRYTHTCVHIHVYICKFICIHTCTHKYRYIHTHTHMFMHMPIVTDSLTYPLDTKHLNILILLYRPSTTDTDTSSSCFSPAHQPTYTSL